MRVQNPDLSALLAGLLQAQWRSMCLFTGRLPWNVLEEHLGRGTAIALHLPQLTRREAIMLMDNLPRLRPEPIATKLAVYRKVGGHPKSLELLNGWLAGGRITDLLNDPQLDDLLAQAWEDYFLRALLAHLPAAEQQQLTRLSIFRTALADEHFDAAGVTSTTRQRWLDLSLLQQEQTATTTAPPQSQLPITNYQFTIHPVVREYLLHRLPAEAQRNLHLWAAGVVGHPFVEMARQAVAQSGQSWTEAEIKSLARYQVVEASVARTDDIPAARIALGPALEWQHHLFTAGQFDPAGELVTAVYDILARWGERDRAKALLRGSIETLEGFGKTVAQGNLANLLSEQGNLAEALVTYDAVYRTFEQLEAKPQMATALAQQSSILWKIGRTDEAIVKQKASLDINREIGDEEAQVISLHQLSILYTLTEDYPTALAHSREAGAMARKLGLEDGVAKTLHGQGLIYNQMARAAEAETKANEYLQTAWEQLQASLDIKRRIGDEAGAGATLAELGTLLLDAGQMNDAIAAFNEVLAIFQRTNNPAKMGGALELLGSVHGRQGHFAAALEKYEQAVALYKQYAPAEVERCQRNIDIIRGKVGG